MLMSIEKQRCCVTRLIDAAHQSHLGYLEYICLKSSLKALAISTALQRLFLFLPLKIQFSSNTLAAQGGPVRQLKSNTPVQNHRLGIWKTPVALLRDCPPTVGGDPSVFARRQRHCVSGGTLWSRSPLTRIRFSGSDCRY